MKRSQSPEVNLSHPLAHPQLAEGEDELDLLTPPKRPRSSPLTTLKSRSSLSKRAPHPPPPRRASQPQPNPIATPSESPKRSFPPPATTYPPVVQALPPDSEDEEEDDEDQIVLAGSSPATKASPVVLQDVTREKRPRVLPSARQTRARKEGAASVTPKGGAETSSSGGKGARGRGKAAAGAARDVDRQSELPADQEVTGKDQGTSKRRASLGQSRREAPAPAAAPPPAAATTPAPTSAPSANVTAAPLPSPALSSGGGARPSPPSGAPSGAPSTPLIPTLSAFLTSLPLPLTHLTPLFHHLGISTPSDLLALASTSEAASNARRIVLDEVSSLGESGLFDTGEGEGQKRGLSRWERIVLEEELRAGWRAWTGKEGRRGSR